VIVPKLKSLGVGVEWPLGGVFTPGATIFFGKK